MTHLFVNAVAASAGGGLTYLRNVVDHLNRREDVRATVWIAPPARDTLFREKKISEFSRIEFLECPSTGSISRFWQEQVELPRLIRATGADVLLSTGNMALRKSPVPQMLLSRNALYTSTQFFRDLRARGDYRIWLAEKSKRFLARQSVRWADCTIAPSAAFAAQLKRWTGRRVMAIHHGFDGDVFFAGHHELSDQLKTKLRAADACVRLLFVSHYNYYRNFETLLRALPLIRHQLAPTPVRLFLTCALGSETNPGAYRANAAAALVKELEIRDEVVELGAVPYWSLHHVYRACGVYITPAYAESFAHPLVEAMASALPVVASDLRVHREICRHAAVYAPVFSPPALAAAVVRILRSRALRERLVETGLERARHFSWVTHVDQIISIAKRLVSGLPVDAPLFSSAARYAQIASEGKQVS